MEPGFLRNEIFARYGRRFKTPKYDQHFKSKSRYVIREEYRDIMLTERDHKNINLILTIERPKLSEQQFEETLLKTIEYEGEGYTMIISDETSIMISLETQEDGPYAPHGEISYHTYFVLGDWIITFKNIAGGIMNDATAYLPNHQTKSIQKKEYPFPLDIDGALYKMLLNKL